jgi:hypothetical protein
VNINLQPFFDNLTKGNKMKINDLKNYVIGFLLGLCMVFLLGAVRTWNVDGHCHPSLSNDSGTGEVYLAITNTSTGQTIVHRFDSNDFARANAITFEADSINKGRLTAEAKR